jgi:hypothetical protein
MKTLVFATALSLLVSAARAQEAPPADPLQNSQAGEQKEQAPAFLGITLGTDGKQVTVNSVYPGSPAAKAGLEPGAVIVGIDNKAVKGEVEVLTGAVRAKKPGDQIELQWRMGNGVKAARITLDSREAPRIAESKARSLDLDRIAGQVKEHMDRKEAEAKERFQQSRKSLPVPDGDPQNFRITPLPRAKFFGSAERQLKELAPEIEVDPYSGPANGDEWKSVPFIDPPQGPHLQAGPFSGPLDRQLGEIAPEVNIDPYKEPGVETPPDFGPAPHFEAVPEVPPPPKPERKSFDLNNPPLRDSQGRFVDPGKVRKREGKPSPEESAVWERVQKRVAGALKKSDLDPGVRAKVMEALEAARREESEQQARQAKLESEIQMLENAAQQLLNRAGKLRQELKKGGE